MPYAYTDPRRESDPYALPDVEVFEVWTDANGKQHNGWNVCEEEGYEFPMSKLDNVDGHWYIVTHETFSETHPHAPDCAKCIAEGKIPETGYEPCSDGWYYQFGSPGYIPSSDPYGPYETEQAALDAARDDCDYDMDDDEAEGQS